MSTRRTAIKDKQVRAPYTRAFKLEAAQQVRAGYAKSRPRKNNDNTLAVGKNGSVVRKAFGYSCPPL